MVATNWPSRPIVVAIVCRTPRGRQWNVDGRVDVDALGHDTGVGGGRTQHEFDVRAAVQADSDGADVPLSVRRFSMA